MEKIKALIPISIKKPIKALVFEIKRYIVESHELYHDVQKINKLKLEKSIKKKIRDTRIRAFYFRRFDKNNNTTNVVGNNIKFNNLNTLKGLFNEIFISQCYWFIADNPKPFIIDCGSHLGQSIVYFKTVYPEAKIIGFEPDPTTFENLKSNISTNNFEDVFLHNNALAATDGEIEFYNMKNSTSSVVMSTIKERVAGGIKSVVKAARLSKFIDREIDFLKMDIEGAEFTVLQELKDRGKLQSVKQMAIEYHHHINLKKDNLSEMLNLLEQAGFGYQIETDRVRPRNKVYFQDIMIYAYNKKYI